METEKRIVLLGSTGSIGENVLRIVSDLPGRFRVVGLAAGRNADRVKTKARAKSYKTGAHGSGAAKHKAEIKQKVRARKSQKRK